MSRRLCLAAFDTLSLSLLVALFTLVPTQAAFAYVDPSVMTYTIQALAGVAVALGAVLGVAMRRTRKALLRLFNVDENARKEVDPDVHRVVEGVVIDSTGQGEAATSEDAAGDGAEKQRGGKRGKRGKQSKQGRQGERGSRDKQGERGFKPSWKRRLVLSFIVALFLVYTVGVVAPYEIVAGSAGSLVFGLNEVWRVMALTAGVFVVVLTLIMTLMRGKLFNAVLLLLFSLGLCAYLQAMFLNLGLSVADGSTIEWSDYLCVTILSLLVWLVILVLPQVASRFRRSGTQIVAAALSLCLVVVQTVGVVSLFTSTDGFPAHKGKSGNEQSYPDVSKQIITEEGLFEVSSGKNVIVFVLDFFDTEELQSVLYQDPRLLDEMTGFTWFQNSVGSMIPTRYAAPFLLTGEFPQPGEKFSTFLAERYDRSTFLSDIADAGYSIGLYSDTLGLEYMTSKQAYEHLSSTTMNVHPVAEPIMDEMGTVKALTRCALYRDAPWVLKRFFWFYTDEVNKMMVIRHHHEAREDIPYVMDDAQYYEKLCSQKLTVEEGRDGKDPLDGKGKDRQGDGDKGGNEGEWGDRSNGAFRFIHLMGAHWPYIMDENAQNVGMDYSDEDRQARGSLHIVSEYLRQLKELGLYDDATIIVASDHGRWHFTDPFTSPTSPIMLIKPACSADDAEAPLQVSYLPISHVDFQATILDAMGVDCVGTGIPAFELDDTPRTRYYYTTDSDGAHDFEIVEYAVEGPVSNFANWHATGEVWGAQE